MMEAIGALLYGGLGVLGLFTVAAFLYRCVNGFESKESRLYLQRIARSLEQIARTQIEAEAD